MSVAAVREAEREARWEAVPAIVVVIGLQASLALASRAGDWTLWRLPWWSWLVLALPEGVLLAALGWSLPRRQLELIGHRETAALALFAVVGAANAVALAALVASIVGGEERDGGDLLFKGLVIWTTNVITFGLWYWAGDRGGPIRRRRRDAPPPDFQFPQMADAGTAEPGWHPRLFDYLYVSFTNSVAFSPTDVMPLTRRAKAMMLAEASASAAVLLLVAARAVNILH